MPKMYFWKTFGCDFTGSQDPFHVDRENDLKLIVWTQNFRSVSIKTKSLERGNVLMYPC